MPLRVFSGWMLLGPVLLLAVGACRSHGSEADDAGESGGAAGTGPGGGGAEGLCPGDPPELVRPEHWTRESHCPGLAPDYDRLFDAEIVHRIDIEISGEDHQAMLDDLDDNYTVTAVPDLDGLQNPIWVPATVAYAGHTFAQVGIRYKGHSSLKAAWLSGIRKLSFRLDFDEYEGDHPELRDQRCFGFNDLSFSNAYNDPSLIRDHVAGDVFREAGVQAARAAFAAVYLDWGDGPVYLGLYTMIEDPSDQMLAAQIGDPSGNLYKPWGDPARWLSVEESGGLTQIETYFERSNNEDTDDWTDVIQALDALHADRSSPEAWRAGLQAVFDVESFIHTLAVNQAMMNWDSYGCMHHNYYVYANPLDDGRLRWFPWDLNESMLHRAHAGCPVPGSVMLDEIVYGDPASSEVDTNWPLIRFILADSTYREMYVQELQSVLDGAFEANAVSARMQRYHDLVAPWVIGPEAVESYPYTCTTAEDFEASLTTGENALLPHVQARHAAVRAALAQ